MEEREQATLDLASYSTRAMMLYGVNVNLQRAIPSIVDGLKPIHRRILYSIYKNIGTESKVTVATSIGQTMKYSPHGDQGANMIYAGISQPFSNNIPLLTPIGNCGTPIAGKDAAASRYWFVKISEFSKDVLFSEFDGKVNMRPNYDNTDVEPITLPAKFPVILLNGSNGVGYTLSSDCLPYNLTEIADATIKLLKNPKARVNLIPDSPTACDIIVIDEESFVMQASYEIDTVNYTITFKNSPFGEYIRDIDEALCEIQKSTNPIKEILSADDESDLVKGKIRYVIRCKPGNMYRVLDTVFKRVKGLRVTVSTRNVNVVDPSLRMKKLQPQQIILKWIANRLLEKRSYLLRDLVKQTTECNMLEGKMFMLSPANLDKTISIFRACRSNSEIIERLVKEYKGHISTSQANYIADTKLRQLTIDEFEKAKAKLKEVKERLEWIRSVVDDPDKIRDVIADDIRTIRSKYGYPRRSKIINRESTSNVAVVQILADGSVMFSDTDSPEKLASDITPINGDEVCLIDEFGQFIWVDLKKIENNKPYALTAIGKTQMGKCISAISSRDHNIVILTNKGRIKYMPVERIPSNQTLKPIIPIAEGESIVSILDLKDDNCDLLVYTSDGMGKRFSVSTLNKVMSVDAQGQFIINGHDVAGMFTVNSNKPLLMYITRLARVRVNHSKFLSSGKKFADIKPIIQLSSKDDLIAVFCVDKDQVATLYHMDGRVTTVHVDSIEPSTMSTPPIKPKHVPAVKVLRATLT